MHLKKFGRNRRKVLRRENINLPTHLEIGAKGEHFSSDKAIMKDISATGVRFELNISEEIPHLMHFTHVPMTFKFPGATEVIETQARVIRVYSYDELDRHVYGLALEFAEISKEEKKRILEFVNIDTSAAG